MSWLRRLTALVITAVLLLTPVIAFAKRQDLADWWRLRDYQPPTAIAELAANTDMTDYGRKLFYVHKPELSDRQEFADKCPGHEQTIVLGCYLSHSRIYVFDVSDERLDGIEEVTAAHEMLHAAYDRLSGDERARVDALLLQAYENLDDQRIKDVVAAYEARDPSVVPNELHSILGTEVRALPVELEQYYSRYFADRGRVVAYSEQYKAVFTAQQQEIESLSRRIAELENELKTRRTDIEQREANLRQEAERLDSLRAQGQIEAYNAAVPEYNRQVMAYRDLINLYNQKVNQLNSLIEQYNSSAVEQKELFDALDSGL